MKQVQFRIGSVKSCDTASAAMLNEDTQKKAAPLRSSKKSEGWREREESKAAGTAPHSAGRRTDEPSLVSFC